MGPALEEHMRVKVWGLWLFDALSSCSCPLINILAHTHTHRHVYIYNALAIPLRPPHMHAIPLGQIECSSQALSDMRSLLILRPFIQPYICQTHLINADGSPLWPRAARAPRSSWNYVINFTVVFLLDRLWRFCNLGPRRQRLPGPAQRSIQKFSA